MNLDKFSKILLKTDFTMLVRYRPIKYKGMKGCPSPQEVIHLSEIT